jgi:hypothetical protein
LSKEFHFRAPTLFDASAKATGKQKGSLHDAPGAAEDGARTKRFAFWLKSEMVNKGLAVNDPKLDEGGWYYAVPPSGGSFVLCILGGSPGDESLFELLVTGIGGATEEGVADAIEQYSPQRARDHGVEGRLTMNAAGKKLGAAVANICTRGVIAKGDLKQFQWQSSLSRNH